MCKVSQLLTGGGGGGGEKYSSAHTLPNDICCIDFEYISGKKIDEYTIK
jgi:hypothetical protein